MQMRIDCLNASKYERSGEDLIENVTRKMLNSRELINSMEIVFSASIANEEKVCSDFNFFAPPFYLPSIVI